MKTNTKQILNILNVICWIIFIGLLINTGGIAFSYVMSLFNPESTRSLYEGRDLSALRDAGFWHYTSVVSFMVALSGLKAYLMYLVIRLFSALDPDHPFSIPTATLITKIGDVALRTGFLAVIAIGYMTWLLHRGISPVAVMQYNWKGSAEFLLLAGILFLVAQIFKRGVELQSENELTI